jgi:membrane protein required for beta-lactamase induction
VIPVGETGWRGGRLLLLVMALLGHVTLIVLRWVGAKEESGA